MSLVLLLLLRTPMQSSRHQHTAAFILHKEIPSGCASLNARPNPSNDFLPAETLQLVQTTTHAHLFTLCLSFGALR
ncbi:MAG: hypothetical protein Q9216_006433 [Gyalolechia sp. 2 TL-2023]